MSCETTSTAPPLNVNRGATAMLSRVRKRALPSARARTTSRPASRFGKHIRSRSRSPSKIVVRLKRIHNAQPDSHDPLHDALLAVRLGLRLGRCSRGNHRLVGQEGLEAGAEGRARVCRPVRLPPRSQSSSADRSTGTEPHKPRRRKTAPPTPSPRRARARQRRSPSPHRLPRRSTPRRTETSRAATTRPTRRTKRR